VHLVASVYMGSSPLTFAEAIFETSVRRWLEVGPVSATFERGRQFSEGLRSHDQKGKCHSRDSSDLSYGPFKLVLEILDGGGVK